MEQTPVSPFQAAAQRLYNDMTSYFQGANGNMWTYGNAFDSMADFLMLTRQSGGSFLDQVYSSFQLPGAWYDDFCWPAIAALKAYDSAYANVFQGTSGVYNQSYSTLFQQYVLANWSVVHDGNPPSPVHALGTQNVWNKIDHITWAAYAPRFSGGSWQCDINNDGDGQNPATNSIGPFQDSVMNGLLLVFATRLGQLASYPGMQGVAAKAQQTQQDQLGFLLNWYGNGSSPDRPAWDEAVLSFPTQSDYDQNNYGSGVLVRERIGTYAQQQGVYPPLSHYDKNRFWGGDQGLQLGGLVDQGSSTAADVAVGIIKGVMNRLSYTDANGNLWIHSCTAGWPGSMCPSCYNAGGVGIFMRNILYAMRSGNTTVLNYMKSEDFGRFIGKLAITALTGPSASIDQNPAFVQLDRLATLNVAMYFEQVLGISLSKSMAEEAV